MVTFDVTGLFVYSLVGHLHKSIRFRVIKGVLF